MCLKGQKTFLGPNFFFGNYSKQMTSNCLMFDLRVLLVVLLSLLNIPSRKFKLTSYQLTSYKMPNNNNPRKNVYLSLIHLSKFIVAKMRGGSKIPHISSLLSPLTWLPFSCSFEKLIFILKSV